MQQGGTRLPYTLRGRVMEGKKIGRRLGFPTANLSLPKGGSLPLGVYAAVMTLPDGRRVEGILNHGRHPTLPEGAPTVEVHLFRFDEDIYGCTVQVTYLRFIRPEQMFESPEAMRRQVMRDIKDVQAYFAAQAGGAP